MTLCVGRVAKETNIYAETLVSLSRWRPMAFERTDLLFDLSWHAYAQARTVDRQWQLDSIIRNNTGASSENRTH